MLDLGAKVSCRFIHVEKGLLFRNTLHHVPRVGDEVRFAENVYYKVLTVVWVYDEDESPYERANIGITEAEE